MCDERGWYVAECECRVCGNKSVDVFPVGCDADNMECANCHNNTCEAVTYIERKDRKDD